MAADELEALRRELPDGAFWPTGKWLRRLIGALISDRARLAQGSGEEIPVDGAGRFFVINPGKGGGSSIAPVPFDVLDASEGATKKLRIRLGTVKSDGTLWVPTGMFLGDATPLVMNAVGTEGVVAAKMTVDGNGATTAAEIYVGATQPADSTTVGYKLLGTYGTDGEGNFLVTNHRVGDQAHLFCGIEHHWAQGSA